MNDRCVIWDREANRLEVSTMELLLNFNFGCFLDNSPGRIVLRCDLTEEQAKRLVNSYAGMLALRSARAA